MKWVLLIYVTLISGCSGIRFCHEPNPDHSCPKDNHKRHPCQFLQSVTSEFSKDSHPQSLH